MANKPVFNTFSSNSQLDVTKLNENFTIVANAIEAGLGRGGTGESPNSMSGNLDMNLNKVINLGAPAADNDAVRLIDLSDSDATGAASAQLRSDLGTDADGLGADLVRNAVRKFDTYSDMEASTSQYEGDSVIVSGGSSIGDGREGNFRWDSSDLSTEVTADTQQGIYVAPASDPTGASGAWVRVYSGAVNVEWFGATDSGDAGIGFNAAMAPGGSVLIPGSNTAKTYTLTTALATSADLDITIGDNVTIVLPSQWVHRGSISIKCGSNTKFLKATGARGFFFYPEEILVGQADASSTDTNIVVSGAGWTTDEHAGKWLLIGTSQGQQRRIISNTSDTLVLEYALGEISGVTVAGGEDVTLNTPNEYIFLDGVHIRGDNSGGGGIVTRYTKNIKFNNCRADSMVAASGNGMTLSYIDRGTITNCYVEDCFIGCLVYNSDEIVISNCIGENNNDYSYQLKDCRNSTIADTISLNDNLHGLNIKCSGLNPAHNLSLDNCIAMNAGSNGLKAHALKNEGQTYNAVGFSVDNPMARGCNLGLNVDDDTGNAVMNCTVTGGNLFNNAVGMAIVASNTLVSAVKVDKSTLRSCTLEGSNIIIDNCEFANGNLDGGTDREIRLEAACQYNIIKSNIFRSSEAASGSVAAALEISGADYNQFIDNIIIDTAGNFTTDYNINGANSIVYSGPKIQVTSATVGRELREYISVNTYNTAGDWVLSVSDLQHGIILRDPAGASRTDTTPNANVLDDLLLPYNGAQHTITYVNTADAAETITLAGGVSVTMLTNEGASDLVLSQGEAAKLTFIRTSTGLVTCLVSKFD